MPAWARLWKYGVMASDFIYIDDVVEATLRLINQPQDCGTYNLGSGAGCSINQVKAVVEGVCDVALNTTYRPARGQDVRSVVLDNSRLNARLGWQAKIELTGGVARTWEWVQHELLDRAHW